MVQKHVLDTEDFSKWRLQDCHDAGQRLLVFDPHQQSSRALLRAVQGFWTLNPDTDISFHFSTEECTRPRYGRNRDDLTENKSLQYDQYERSNAMNLSQFWSRRPLSDLTEASWAPQQVGRLNIMLHFDPPSPQSTSELASDKRFPNKPYSEIEFAGFEDDPILPYATALQRLSKIRADKAEMNVKTWLKDTSASMKDVAMTDAEKSASENHFKAIHHGMETGPPIQVPSLPVNNTSRPIIPQHSRKRIKAANAESDTAMQGSNNAIGPPYNAVATPGPMEMNKMPASKHFQSTAQNTSSPAEQRFDNPIATIGTNANAHFGQGPMHFQNWMDPPGNTFGYHVNASVRSTQDNRDPTPTMSAPSPSNQRGGIADAIRRRSKKASLGFGARAMQSPLPKRNNTGDFGEGIDSNKPYDYPPYSIQTDATDNHLDLEQRVHSSSRHVNAILTTSFGTVLKEVSDPNYERVTEDSEPEL
ncbi:hypothetical protein HII31_01788 [Pseudocercospora fuligena]|uniref:Uncharacterized protein n=1 Tax=Pseudocercospora fuligena TaxID=685502 RepID=A0A8H6VM55_9PEZI|nr:hypothetical protein HII31_01788 [Pseudocercospora fuligena]